MQNPDSSTSGYSRRRFLTLGAATLAASTLATPMLHAESKSSDTSAPIMPLTNGVFEVAPLPYAYDALVPSIDEATMQLHHNKHYAAYTKNLNEALDKAPELKSKSIEALLTDIKGLPQEVRKAIRNNGGGYYNHSLFWRMITPERNTKPEAALAAAIDKAFGSFDEFKAKFSKEASTVFGSGWTWLIVNPKGELEITSTPNQDVPIMDVAETPGKPILGLDVWEHAYYLKYKNVRADYIKNWWEIVNWKTVSELYAAAKA